MKITLWLFLITLIGCGTRTEVLNQNDFSEKPFITLNFSDRKEFKLDSSDILSFVFSPVRENHLWVATSNNRSYDLNLENGIWTILDESERSLAYNVKQENIRKDEFDPNLVWIIYSGLSKLTLYDAAKRKSRVFLEIGAVKAIVMDSANVWFGTSNGLYRYERAKENLAIVNDAPKGHVQHLRFQNAGKLNINDEYIYDISAGSIEKIADASKPIPLSVPFQNLSVVNDNNQYVTIKAMDGHALYMLPYYSWQHISYEENTIWIPANELIDGMVKIDVTSQDVDTFPIGYYFNVEHISADSKYIWVGNRREAMAINKQTGEALFWTLPFESFFTIDYQDTRHLYLHDDHSIVIMPKEKVLNESIPLALFKNEEEAYNRLHDSLKIQYDHEIRSWYKKFKIINTAFKQPFSPRVLASISNSKRWVKIVAPDDSKPFDVSLFSFIDSIEEPYVRADFMYSLIIYAARKGELQRAIDLDSRLTMEFPDQDLIVYEKEQLIEIRKAYQSILVMESKKLPADERLWETGNIYLKLFEYIGRDGEVMKVMDYPLSLFNDLIRKYPASQFADNAAYLTYFYDVMPFREGDDSWYSMEVDQWYNRFIERYPKSDLIPKVYLDLVGMYYSPGPGSKDRKKYLNLAKQYADKFYREYPAHPLKPEMDQYMEYVNEELKGQQ